MSPWFSLIVRYCLGRLLLQSGKLAKCFHEVRAQKGALAARLHRPRTFRIRLVETILARLHRSDRSFDLGSLAADLLGL